MVVVQLIWRPLAEGQVLVLQYRLLMEHGLISNHGQRPGEVVACPMGSDVPA